MTAGRWEWTAAERWLADKVGIDGRDLFAGTSSPESRSERIRAAILEQGLAETHAGHRYGQSTTFAEVFETIYGQALTPANSQVLNDKQSGGFLNG